MQEQFNGRTVESGKESFWDYVFVQNNLQFSNVFGVVRNLFHVRHYKEDVSDEWKEPPYSSKTQLQFTRFNESTCTMGIWNGWKGVVQPFPFKFGIELLPPYIIVPVNERHNCVYVKHQSGSFLNQLPDPLLPESPLRTRIPSEQYTTTVWVPESPNPRPQTSALTETSYIVYDGIQAV